MPRQPSLPPSLGRGQKVRNTISILLTYLPIYILDYVLDWTNGLNLAGIISTRDYNVFNVGEDARLNKLCNFYNHTESPGFHWSDKPDVTYGLITIFTTFVPGLCCALGNIFGYIFEKEIPYGFTDSEALWKLALKTIALIFFYPLYVCYLIIKACYKQDNLQFEKLLIVISMEAFLESAPQILLQLHIIMNGQCPTIIQLVSLSFSIISICKVAIEFHVGSQIFFTIGFSERIMKTLKLLPLYMSCLYFRIGTLVLLVSHFEWWVLIPLCIIIIILVIIAKRNGHTEMQSFLAGPINLLVMAQGIDTSKLVASKQQEELQELNVEKKKAFYKTSTWVIFFIYSILLLIFVALWAFNYTNDLPKFEEIDSLINHWKKKVFMRESIKSYGLYIVVSSILFSGLLNIIFLTIDVSSTLENDTSHPGEEQTEITEIPSPSSATGSHPFFFQLSSKDGHQSTSSSRGEIRADRIVQLSRKDGHQSVQSFSSQLSTNKPRMRTPPDSSDSEDNDPVYQNQDIDTTGCS